MDSERDWNNLESQTLTVSEFSVSRPRNELPRKKERTENETNEKIHDLQHEIGYVNNKLQSLLYSLALKEKENNALKSTLEKLEEDAQNKNNAKNVQQCVCSSKCSIF